MSTYRQQQPAPVRTGAVIDHDYDYKAAKTPTPTTASAAGISEMRAYQTGAPPPPPPPPQQQQQQQQHLQSARSNGSVSAQSYNSSGAQSMDGDEALLDLAQLEELHQEAERMKALGNKHMAAQVCVYMPE
jgi:hypothetical protein